MKLSIKILASLMLAFPFSVSTISASKGISWTDAKGTVSYTTNAYNSTVVKKALEMFSTDMLHVTGAHAKARTNAPICIYELDQLSDKEFTAIGRMRLPISSLITKKDAFYIGIRNNKIIVLGSDGRGTAYGILELSRIAGVSPWEWWHDVKPQPQKQLVMRAGYESLQIPSVEYRGLQIGDKNLMKSRLASQVMRLMLRLRINTYWKDDSNANEKSRAYDMAVADSFDMCIGNVHQIQENIYKRGKSRAKVKHHKHKIPSHSTWIWHDYCPWLCTHSPGEVYADMLEHPEYAQYHVWVASIDNPKFAPYPLSLITDMAWNSSAVRASKLQDHMGQWLTLQFGSKIGKQLVPLMSEYYRLTSIRKSEYMVKPYAPGTEFHSGEFGNELERYLYSYEKLMTKVETVEKQVPQVQRDAYYELVKYPILIAACIAERELEAQEARHIARPGTFRQDEEAKCAAALSIQAQQRLSAATNYYTKKVAGGKWEPFFDTTWSLFNAAKLPGTLTAAEVKRYVNDAIDRTELRPLYTLNADFEAKNSCDWKEILGKGVLPIDYLGHSNRAVSILKGSGLQYLMVSPKSGDARFTLATIPVPRDVKEAVRVSVKIDNLKPIVINLREDVKSQDFQHSVYRGQTLKSFYLPNFSQGRHTVEIMALDDHVILDQWMLDYDVDREYYMIPTYGKLD